MNIEHTLYELTAHYEPFEGICLVDTFELAEDTQHGLFTEANTARVERQKRSPIRVVIGNPPYNVGQVNENDNNRNRKYPAIDRRVRETYAHASRASSTSKLRDPYIRALRWATDRIGAEGVVAFVCNSGFLDGIATDGLRKYLEQEFDRIYVLDLGGNVRRNPRLSGTKHNVFRIKIGVSINLLVRKRDRQERAEIFYFRTTEDWSKEQKYGFLEEKKQVSAITWKRLEPDARHSWLTHGIRSDFGSFIPLGSKKALVEREPGGVFFRLYSLGVTTNRDAWAYNFDREVLAENIGQMIDVYNNHVVRWPLAAREGSNLDDWVESDKTKIAWSEGLKNNLRRGRRAEFTDKAIRPCLLRPFTSTYLYYDAILNERPRRFRQIFPESKERTQNRGIWVKLGGEWPFFCLAANRLVDLLPQGGSQFFPFYSYSTDGTNCRENLTDWTLAAFRQQYSDPTITKWDIFHYIYGVLHHPAYRMRYAANLRRELPRLPFAPEFWSFVTAGARLAELHVDYEQQLEFPLNESWKEGAPLDFRVVRMKYNAAAGEIVYNQALTLSGIPSEAERFRLGHKSALGWVVDQYRVTEDEESGIVKDPNRGGDPQYILRLIRQVVTVSIETVRLVESLPGLGLPEPS